MISAGVAQLVEHHVANVDVASSSLVSRSIGKLAKWLRQRTLNPSILGSNPRFPTILTYRALSSGGQSTRLITGGS